MDKKADQYATDITLKFQPSSRIYIEDYLKEGLMETDPQGNIILRLKMPENEWLYGMILSYGDMVEVLEPDHLRDIIMKKSLKILKKYHGPKDI